MNIFLSAASVALAVAMSHAVAADGKRLPEPPAPPGFAARPPAPAAPTSDIDRACPDKSAKNHRECMDKFMESQIADAKEKARKGDVAKTGTRDPFADERRSK